MKIKLLPRQENQLRTDYQRAEVTGIFILVFLGGGGAISLLLLRGRPRQLDIS
jgi:hypothetical protein